MKKNIFCLCANCVWATICAVLMIKFGTDVDALITIIRSDLALGVSWGTILHQASMPGRFLSVVGFVTCLYHTCIYYSGAVECIWRMTHKTKEQRDTEKFIRWMRKENRRLKKLEGAC